MDLVTIHVNDSDEPICRDTPTEDNPNAIECEFKHSNPEIKQLFELSDRYTRNQQFYSIRSYIQRQYIGSIYSFQIKSKANEQFHAGTYMVVPDKVRHNIQRIHLDTAILDLAEEVNFRSIEDHQINNHKGIKMNFSIINITNSEEPVCDSTICTYHQPNSLLRKLLDAQQYITTSHIHEKDSTGKYQEIGTITTLHVISEHKGIHPGNYILIPERVRQNIHTVDAYEEISKLVVQTYETNESYYSTLGIKKLPVPNVSQNMPLTQRINDTIKNLITNTWHKIQRPLYEGVERKMATVLNILIPSAYASSELVGLEKKHQTVFDMLDRSTFIQVVNKVVERTGQVFNFHAINEMCLNFITEILYSIQQPLRDSLERNAVRALNVLIPEAYATGDVKSNKFNVASIHSSGMNSPGIPTYDNIPPNYNGYVLDSRALLTNTTDTNDFIIFMNNNGKYEYVGHGEGVTKCYESRLLEYAKTGNYTHIQYRKCYKTAGISEYCDTKQTSILIFGKKNAKITFSADEKKNREYNSSNGEVTALTHINTEGLSGVVIEHPNSLFGFEDIKIHPNTRKVVVYAELPGHKPENPLRKLKNKIVSSVKKIITSYSQNELLCDLDQSFRITLPERQHSQEKCNNIPINYGMLLSESDLFLPELNERCSFNNRIGRRQFETKTLHPHPKIADLGIPKLLNNIKNRIVRHFTQQSNFSRQKVLSPYAYRYEQNHEPYFPRLIEPAITRMIVSTNQLGKKFGQIACKVTDYLIDHVPSHMIDTSHPMILRCDRAEITFEKRDLQFIKYLVNANQTVNSMVFRTQTLHEQFQQNIQRYVDNTRSSIQSYSHRTGEIMINLDRNVSLMKQLNTTIHQITGNVPSIDTKILEQHHNIDRNEYANLHNEMLQINSDPYRTKNAHVEFECNNQNWKLVFTIPINLVAVAVACGCVIL